MSYASIASHNIPEGEMPHPDQGLADGHFAGETEESDNVDGKINVLPAGTDLEHPDIHHHSTKKEPLVSHPVPVYEPSTSASAPKPTEAPKGSEIHIPQSGEEWEKKIDSAEKKTKETAKEAEKKTKEVANAAGKKVDKAEDKVKETAAVVEKNTKEAAATVEKKTKETAAEVEKKAKEVGRDLKKEGKKLEKKARAELEEVESALAPYWERTKDIVLRPGTLGGLMGVVNVGILGTAGYFAYTRRDQPWDRRIVGGAVAGTLALFGVEGYVTDSYLNTPEGREEAERAKREGSRAWLQTKEIVLRPGVFGGLAGVVNLAVLGTVGYFGYQNWNYRWDQRYVMAIGAGLVALSGIEGYAGKAYVDKELPKR